MGYETKLLIGHASSLTSEEIAYTKRRYSDGSGFHPKMHKGKIVRTGRKEHWFNHMATVDLCKLGDGPLSDLISLTHKRAKECATTDVHYYFADDGNTRIIEDRYGDGFYPVSVAEALAAAKAMAGAETYRRLKWAIALLESMKGESEGLSVLFYGH